MKRFWVCALALVLALPLISQAQRKSEPAAPATEEEYKQLAKNTEVVGKLGSAAGKSLSLIIESQQTIFDPTKITPPTYQTPQFQPNINQNDYNRQVQYMNLMRQMQELQFIQDPNQRAQRYRSVMQQMQQMQVQMMQQQAQQTVDAQRRMMEEMRRQQELAIRNQKAAIKVETTARSFDFTLKDNLIIRRMNLPFAYDDKGNVKQYTLEEMQKLKGTNPKLPGYEAKMEDLEPGQMVRLYIAPPKEGKVGAVDLVGNIIKPEVRVVVIYGDYDALMSGADPNKKN